MNTTKAPSSLHHHQSFTYKLYPPHPSLSPFVRCYWIMKTGAQSLNQELMIPDGYADLIFNYGQMYRRTEISPELQWLDITSSHIVGERSSSVLVDHNTYLDVVGIKLKPYGLWVLTQIPAKNFFRQVVPLDLLRLGLDELEQQIYDALSDVAKIQIIEDFLTKRLLLFTTEHREVQAATQFILNAKGVVRIKTVAETVNLSYKTLERSFNQFIGMPPKAFARVIRFKKMLQAIKRSPTDHQHLYLDFGYYDQTHFIKEFKQFMGVTPSAYLNQQFLAEDKFFSLGMDNNDEIWLSSPTET